MSKVRVAHVITRLCKGGAQENTVHTVRLANRQRFAPDLISGPTSGLEGSIEPLAENAGIPIHREPFLVRQPAPVRDMVALRRLERRFRRERYDIVHTHTSKAGFLGRLAAARAGVPIIVHTPHGNIFHGYFPAWKTRLFIWMERHAARRTHRIIELTAGGIEAHLAEGIGRREQYTTVFSGIDTGPFETAAANRAAIRARLGYGPEDFVVGGVGRLEHVKGFDYFVEAAQRAAAAVPEARFLVAGDGAEAAPLKAAAAPLGERIRFLGLREDVPELMAAMDVLVVPSRNEGMGRVVLEAGAAGIPVVAFRAGGIPDVLDDNETGLLAPPGDAGALAGAVVALAGSPERRRLMGATARAKVVPHYRLEIMVQRIESLYEELLDERTAHARR
mgnify:CR=1 FL=1